MDDDRYIPLSYISQFNYCKRRAGLLMLEQQWNDSTDTIKGSAEHRNVHKSGIEYREGKCLITELQVFSKRMGLSGKCDAIEAVPCINGVKIPFIEEKSFLFPIEYKHGKLRNEKEYELQLCAQAICLEEMYSTSITSGAIFYINSHRRKEIVFDESMRISVEETVSSLSEMLNSKQVPKAEHSAKCVRCSLKDICMPEITYSVRDYMKSIKKEMRRCDI